MGAALALEFRKRKAPAEAAGNSVEATGLSSGEMSPVARPSFDGRIEPSPASSANAASANSYQPVSPAIADGRSIDDAAGKTDSSSLVDLNAPEERHSIIDGDT